ncbi:hypothetical protein Cni_G13901 [Canna indica]|uniref:Uncharacterized protein n=1 Tax=Canna indica TaxID=4628 RepID=A0AAQ3QE71_9LILI|nr:hypothetical protein Cni_G13901 [Canna indica]
MENLFGFNWYQHSDWKQISSLLQDVKAKEANLKIALIHFNDTEVRFWQQAQPQIDISSVSLDYADTSITWKVLYPEWIDEEEENNVPACPSLPVPQVDKGAKFNLSSSSYHVISLAAGPRMWRGYICSSQQQNSPRLLLLLLLQDTSKFMCFLSPSVSRFQISSLVNTLSDMKEIFGSTSRNHRHCRRSFGFRLDHASLQSLSKQKVS